MQLRPFGPPRDLRLDAFVVRRGGALLFTYRLEGELSQLVFPYPEPSRRTDGLWQSTCFEAFIAIGPSNYIELNFAPSGAWAAYRFTGYRNGMSELDIAPPKIEFRDHCLVAELELNVAEGAALNLSAVIEEKGRGRTFWALAHPEGDRPDFHLRDCFIAKLP